MKVGALLVSEEQVGFPETLEHLGVDGERVGLEVVGQLQPGVVPALPQEDVDSVILLRFKSRQAQARLRCVPRSCGRMLSSRLVFSKGSSSNVMECEMYDVKNWKGRGCFSLFPTNNHCC